MQMKISRTGVAGIADIAKGLAPNETLSLDYAIRIALKMGIVIRVKSRGIELVESDSAPRTLKELDDNSIGRR